MHPEGEFQFDAAIRERLRVWRTRIGDPSCGAGCSGCCERTTLVVSSAEACRLLDWLAAKSPKRLSDLRKAWHERLGRLRRNLHLDMSEAESINTLLREGGCLLLQNSQCSVYEARPDTCRSVYVWHESAFCGREEYDTCTPAELQQLRIDRMFEVLLDESQAGRVPFVGHLSVVLALMDKYREQYDRGEDLMRLIDRFWVETSMLRFFNTSGKLEDALHAERHEYRTLFTQQAWPLGQPKMADVQSRGDLQAFHLVPE